VNRLRDEFLLESGVIYLNHGSFGATPRAVFESYQRWQLQLERQPVRFLSREHDELLRQSRGALGEYLGADPDDLVYVPNATHGINIVARSLRLEPGDEILSSNHEYGACEYTWEFVCAKAGATYVKKQLPLAAVSDSDLVDRFWEGVTGRTRLIFLSHITSPTAVRFPVEDVCRRAREAGILTLIDGAHAPGQIPLDLAEIGADFYTGNCHKWMVAPKGAAFLHARREVQPLIEPLVVSWGFHPNGTPSVGSQFLDYLQWSGTRDPAAALAVPDAIDFMAEHQWESIRRECHRLLSDAISRVCELTQLPSPGVADVHLGPQMGIAPIPTWVDLPRAKTRLYDEFRLEVPLIEWEGQKFVRISIQGYNDEGDIDVLLDGLKAVLAQRGS
jgi:isopenicillin-N epimerase